MAAKALWGGEKSLLQKKRKGQQKHNRKEGGIKNFEKENISKLHDKKEKKGWCREGGLNSIEMGPPYLKKEEKKKKNPF